MKERKRDKRERKKERKAKREGGIEGGRNKHRHGLYTFHKNELKIDLRP